MSEQDLKEEVKDIEVEDNKELGYHQPGDITEKVGERESEDESN